jgi:uncharacterized membrane protein YozB (DUF420 family)
MARLHSAFSARPDLRLVSIHVAPQDEDTGMLDQFARQQGANDQWLFLRGDPYTLKQMLQDSFKVGWSRDPSAPTSRRVTHSFFLFLIDPDGQILGYVDGRDPAEVQRLEQRIRELLPTTGFREQARAILPSVNAGLNALCTVLLLAGYVAIRRRRETLHIGLMLSALGVSAAFLASYLFYHVAVESKPFPGEGPIQVVYFSVLISHIILAALVLPLALATAYLGLRDLRSAHRRLARWTFPIWLYVSVTGVIVYLMLYQLYTPS